MYEQAVEEDKEELWAEPGEREEVENSMALVYGPVDRQLALASLEEGCWRRRRQHG